MKANLMFLQECWAHRPGTDPYSQRYIPSLPRCHLRIGRYLKECGYKSFRWKFTDDNEGEPVISVFSLNRPKDVVAVRIMERAVEQQHDDPVAEGVQVLSRLYPPPRDSGQRRCAD